MYLENKLVQPGAFEVDGVGIDLSTVDVPCYFISTHDDHIAPWKCTYRGARLFSGPVRFVLGGSGHIAGIVNPPDANKYCYWTGPEELSGEPDEWLAEASEHEGSWWTDWNKWLRKRSRAMVPARQPGDGGLDVIEDAPGSYVAQRI
jgi:polyhydroxyalkanoate synthase